MFGSHPDGGINHVQARLFFEVVLGHQAGTRR